jgi:hypothetical protein
MKREGAKGAKKSYKNFANFGSLRLNFVLIAKRGGDGN